MLECSTPCFVEHMFYTKSKCSFIQIFKCLANHMQDFIVLINALVYLVSVCSLYWMLSLNPNISHLTPLSMYIHSRQMVHDAVCFSHVRLHTFPYLAVVTIPHSNCNNCPSLSVKQYGLFFLYISVMFLFIYFKVNKTNFYLALYFYIYSSSL